jgi:hypothetical protein
VSCKALSRFTATSKYEIHALIGVAVSLMDFQLRRVIPKGV